MWLSLSLLFLPFLLPEAARLPNSKRDYSAYKDISAFNLTIFEQYIDHENPSLGTFQQRIWSNDEYWKGPGSPVVMFSPGEDDASTYPNYMTNRKINGAMAEEIGGAIVMVEHRYWGKSSPYDKLTVKNLQYLTVNQSILDFVNIAKTVQLPFDTTNSSQAGVAPWVFAGGSYIASLATWTNILFPDVFWASYASSAPVANVFEFWAYYDPIRQGMPANCSKDVELVMQHVDSVITSGDEANITALKTMFGAEEIEHLDDFASIFLLGPNIWQGTSFNFSQGYTEFDEWCDYVETAASPDAAVPDKNGVGLEKALTGYAKWMKTIGLPDSCASYGYSDWQDPNDLGCYNTHNATVSIYTDVAVDNTALRQWMWYLCSNFANWQVGGATPTDIPAIVARSLTSDYDINMCNLYFPTETDEDGKQWSYNEDFIKSNYSVDSFQDELDAWNGYTKGFDIEGLTKRMIFVNGEFDPWIDLTVSSPSRPGGPINSTADQPILLIPGALHTSEMEMANGPLNSEIDKVQKSVIAQIKTWVAEYPAK